VAIRPLAAVEAAATPNAAPSEFVVATLNIWHDQQDWPARMALILDALRTLDPDVVFLQEVLEKEGLPNQAAALAESLGCAFIFTSVDPPGAPRRYGNAILTRHRLVETHEVKLEPLNDYRVAAHVRLNADGRTVDAYVTHLHHTAEGASIRARQVLDLLAFIDSTHVRGAMVLGGDFNAAPDAPELRPIRERLIDTFAAVHPTSADTPVTTLNPAKGHLPHRIDHIFAGPGLLRAIASEVFLDAPGAGEVWASDHFGVWTRFRWVE
jgi:endonuclease/exonuclease/phosphatase family metal-dependent hydrolase